MSQSDLHNSVYLTADLRANALVFQSTRAAADKIQAEVCVCEQSCVCVCIFSANVICVSSDITCHMMQCFGYSHLQGGVPLSMLKVE